MKMRFEQTLEMGPEVKFDQFAYKVGPQKLNIEFDKWDFSSQMELGFWKDVVTTRGIDFTKGTLRLIDGRITIELEVKGK